MHDSKIGKDVWRDFLGLLGPNGIIRLHRSFGDRGGNMAIESRDLDAYMLQSFPGLINIIDGDTQILSKIKSRQKAICKPATRANERDQECMARAFSKFFALCDELAMLKNGLK